MSGIPRTHLFVQVNPFLLAYPDERIDQKLPKALVVSWNLSIVE